ncbi:TonB-dependent receptor [Xanthomonas vesicatoria]|uniref:TonB-dependent receptor n=1 Tax=Xanthomonas vesicatoria TaxID=56460 RepID=UPI001E4C555F|nr:TonB-dependent receptor [Xanthomonas vesicatoria]MCC8619498.1 TonB-dependent receptor [Xanthomonas vesicatoria]MCC8625314.1 TonB-dependent receptor [Xanthomonas vesicatoria]MCC8633148.1 TonB-dependent receptor [Xanthomonas vesicatoria]MDG4481500.1 TonB-dependent receptor [Xanthomonas vesicatoria]
MTPRVLSAAIVSILLSSVAGTVLGADAAAAQTTDMDTVTVTAKLEAARNSLSPDIGSSQFVITADDIDRLPLGASTPLNQVLLQAPGVVQDSYGGIHVRGDHANLQYRINGVMLPESISGFGQSLEPRIIKNLKLLDGALPAQFGDRTAAVVDITTKNGAELGNGGSVGITGGSYDTVNPNASLWGSSGRWSWFVTGDYEQNTRGLENPVDSRSPQHDKTRQGKGFADLSYLINENTRLSLLVGYANNRFQIPNNPGQTPEFDYLGTTDFDSSRLDENQRETTRFGTLALQGTLGETSYQLSAGQRYSSVAFSPDVAGDLIFNGIASQVDRSNRANTVQADFSTPWGSAHTLRYGLYGNFEHAIASNNSFVFPADADGNQSSNVPVFIPDGSRFHASTYALYLQDEWKIGEDWTVNYGVRGDRYKAFGASEGQLSPRLGVVWTASDSTTVHAGYARYFTPPASELISTSDIALYQGTTNQQSTGDGPTTPLSERSDYYDLGISQVVSDHLTLGLDTYYRKADRLQDEGQFGAAYVYSTFNYRYGRIRGAEFSADYSNGPVTAYFNLAYSKAMGKQVTTSLYNFDPDALAYAQNDWIHLDHDQKLTSSGGINYVFGDSSRIGANYLYGSGLRTDTDTVPNGGELPSYFQLNLSAGHDFALTAHPLHAQLAVLNVLDRIYQLRDGGGIGVFAPQWAPRRGVYLSLQQTF